MTKFLVTVVKEIWKKAEIEVEAADESAANDAAIEQAEEDETITWCWERTQSYDAVAIEPLQEADKHEDTNAT